MAMGVSLQSSSCKFKTEMTSGTFDTKVFLISISWSFRRDDICSGKCRIGLLLIHNDRRLCNVPISGGNREILL